MKFVAALVLVALFAGVRADLPPGEQPLRGAASPAWARRQQRVPHETGRARGRLPRSEALGGGRWGAGGAGGG